MNQTSRNPLYVHYAGSSLLATPLLNKGSAFSEEERLAFNLMGLLPPAYETIDEQVERAYLQYSSFRHPINKHIYLRSVQDNNETLFYRLLRAHIEEMMPIIYTPIVGDACEQFSDIYRVSRGLFIAYPQRHHIDDILHNATKQKVKIIVVTDGERILGLGDQGIGGMGIPIGKLSLYTTCGGISPAYTLPIMLDVGTNNPKLLNDPKYMGWRHERIDQKEYNEFLDLFMSAVQRRWKPVVVQFEDFAQKNATPLLNRYRHEFCCFNDDIQGTAAVTLGCLLAACRIKHTRLSDQTVVIAGAGSAGCGIAEQIIRAMCAEGLTQSQARCRIFMIDRFGLLTEGMTGLQAFQQKLVHPEHALGSRSDSSQYPSLAEVIQTIKPGILIGVSGQPGLFSKPIVDTMKQGCQQPVIFPLSNPSKYAEATPEDLIKWTNSSAIIATGSPFTPVEYAGTTHTIPQCNNSYIFPGMGLGVIAVKSALITDEMLMAASQALALSSPLANTGEGNLLPRMTHLAEVSKKIAFAVAQVAMAQKLAPKLTDEHLQQAIEENFWKPEYRDYKRLSI